MSDKTPFIQSTGVSIDSAKLRIPIQLVKVLDQDLLESEWVTINANTLTEKSREWKSEAVTQERHDGALTRYKIEKGRGSRHHETFVTIGINSKILGDQYQQGITWDTLDCLLLQIQQDGLIEVNRDSLLQGRMTDVDLKRDFNADDLVMQSLMSDLRKLTVFTRDMNKGAKMRNSKTNKGIWWNSRDTSTMSSPYVKIYSKSHDFQWKSKQFADTHFQQHDMTGVWRMEGQVKDSKHWSRYGVTDCTLRGILDLPQDTLKHILDDLFKQNLDVKDQTHSTSMKQSRNMNATSQLHLSFVVFCLEQGLTPAETYHKVTRYITNVDAIKRTRKRTAELLDMVKDGVGEAEDVPKEIRKKVQTRQEEYERILTDVLTL